MHTGYVIVEFAGMDQERQVSVPKGYTEACQILDMYDKEDQETVYPDIMYQREDGSLTTEF